MNLENQSYGSIRSQITARRTYNRPLNDEGTLFETWEETCGRVIKHQRKLADDMGLPLSDKEANRLYHILLHRKGLVAGRVLWLGGTPTIYKVPCAAFNCSFTNVETVHDMVDVFWLLLNGCGVGFRAVTGSLFGFPAVIPSLQVIPSTQSADFRGDELNHETWDPTTGHWTIRIGDSARAWAKAIGKLLAGCHRSCKILTLDFSQIRGPGSRLSGYGWICAGHSNLAKAMRKIFEIRNLASGRLLTRADIHDVVNLLGTVLSTRRSAQLCLCDMDDEGILDFTSFKSHKEVEWGRELEHRFQSNNTVNYTREPDEDMIYTHITQIMNGKRGEPGIRNAVESTKRAPWSKGTNPCAEILLPNKGFCNLVEINLAHPDHLNDFTDLLCTIEFLARANYRQTCVDLRDGILQHAWHENNQNIRLCGVGVTGISQRSDLTDDQIRKMRQVAVSSANDIALAAGLPKPQAVTTVKPSGTLSKIMDCSEGIHDPLGEFIFNNIVFPREDPLVPKLKSANYRVVPHPSDPHSVLVTLPVHYPGFRFPADTIQMLDRYIRWNTLWADHNVSCSIYYNPNRNGIARLISTWLKFHWNDGFVSVSFFPTSGADYIYLPQEVVDEATYTTYLNSLKPITINHKGILYEPEPADCEGGHCPIR